MTLTLEITATSEARPGDATRHVFGEEGGSIGRASTNSWVLTHNKVSGQHAQISFRNGVFYILDISRNGVSVNAPENRLVRNRPYALKAGDRIYIEPYEIDVWIEASPQRVARVSRPDSFAADDPFAPRPMAVPLPGVEPLPPSPADEEVDPLKFFEPVGGRGARSGEPPPRPADDFLEAHYQPPAVVPAPAPAPPPRDPLAIPQGYDPLRPDEPFLTPVPIRPRPGDSAEIRRRAKETAAPESTVRQPPPTAPTGTVPDSPTPLPPSRQAGSTPRNAGHTVDLSELLAGAGVPEAVVTPELSRNLGQILQIVVAGLMDVLQSRQRIKEEFRMHQTMFRPIDNNPLKFSANVEDALHNLLVKRNAAYLGPVEAFADAFDDLRDHQLAMLEGLRVAFEAMLAEFDADRLQQEFDEQLSKLSLPLVPAKMRYWDLYREKRQEIVKDPEAAFARLFGEEFRQAYEEQFRKLKAKRRARNRPESLDAPPPSK